MSRVLNGHTNIAQGNFDRVQKAIEELGYENCRSAEQLLSRRSGSRVRTGNIGLIYSEMAGDWASHPLVAAYSMGVERACQEKGFHVLIEFSGESENLPRCVQENKVDGLLLKATRALPGYLKDIPSDLPVVCMGFNEPTAQIQQVAPDNSGAGWLVADYLWSMGHRRIEFVCSNLAHPMFLARYQGYEGFLRSKHEFESALCALDESNQFHRNPESQPPSMTEAVNKLLAAPGAPVTAIIAAND